MVQQNSIYNVLNRHCKVPGIFQYFNILEIFSKYYGAMWDVTKYNNYYSFIRMD